jgi:hypothetical protein
MDAVERARQLLDGPGLNPFRQRRRFVSRQKFAATSSTSVTIDLAAFRADQEAVSSQDLDDPYGR